MFLTHIEVLEPFNTFSKYTPLNPLLKQARDTANKPNSLLELLLLMRCMFSASETGHYMNIIAVIHQCTRPGKNRSLTTIHINTITKNY